MLAETGSHTRVHVSLHAVTAESDSFGGSSFIHVTEKIEAAPVGQPKIANDEIELAPIEKRFRAGDRACDIDFVPGPT